MGIFEREFFLKFCKTLMCHFFCETKTYHKVIAHPSQPLVVHVDTFRGHFQTASSWLIVSESFLEGVLFVFQRVCDQENLH